MFHRSCKTTYFNHLTQDEKRREGAKEAPGKRYAGFPAPERARTSRPGGRAPMNTSAFPWAMALPVDSRHRWTAATLKLHLHRVTAPSGEVLIRYTSVVPRLDKLSPLAVENLRGKLTF